MKSATQPSYLLNVQENLIVITGNGKEGLFYGIQTMRQLVNYSTTGMQEDSQRYKNHHLQKTMNSEENRIKSAYDKIQELERELSGLVNSVAQERKQDMDEFLVSADGLALFQALLLVIKRNFLGQNDTSLIYRPKVLAEKLEYWFTGYKRVWRSRNKESELFRIKDVIMGICKLLRG